MAVKVIDDTPDQSIVKRIICRNCGVKLEYVPNDVKTFRETDYTGSSDIISFINCPKCQTKVRGA